jgi:hypothetical protein
MKQPFLFFVLKKKLNFYYYFFLGYGDSNEAITWVHFTLNQKARGCMHEPFSPFALQKKIKKFVGNCVNAWS